MTINDVVLNPIFQWGITLVAGGTIIIFIQKSIRKIGNVIVLETKSGITSIDDPDLKIVAQHAIRYAAKRFPKATGNRKLDLAIAAVQKATPNFFISDDKLKELIQSEYDKVKGDLSNI